jgi:hypothetical protein
MSFLEEMVDIGFVVYDRFLKSLIMGDYVFMIYKKLHWTKADYSIVEGRFNDAIDFIENSREKDDEFKHELFKKVYRYATQKAGISDPDHPILQRLYNNGIIRRDPIMFWDKKKGQPGHMWGRRGKWTKTFPIWKKKMEYTRRTPRRSNRQTRRNSSISRREKEE